ncbi:hypothetical protein [Streptomyces sp. NPDC059378]|uniref:hypothetical protein n=1 Tax=Streptomyces sp. NPDC059378 TaxID=3346815 RepID=UPI0036783BB2
MSAHIVRPFDDEPPDDPAGPEVPHAARLKAAVRVIATPIPRRVLKVLAHLVPGPGNLRMVCLSSLGVPYSYARQLSGRYETLSHAITADCLPA